jgi:hypothetical protein
LNQLDHQAANELHFCGHGALNAQRPPGIIRGSNLEAQMDELKNFQKSRDRRARELHPGLFIIDLHAHTSR